MMSKILYISYYDVPSNNQNRNAVLAAVNKMNYICETIEKNGDEVEIVSAAPTLDKKYYKKKRSKVSDKTTLQLFATLPSINGITALLNRWFIKLQMLLYMLKNSNSDSTVIVYHSLGYMSLVKFLKKVKKFNLIIEAEEIYGDVINNAKARAKEIEFFKIADSFIFPTELLSSKVNTENKPECFIYGTYKVQEDRKNIFNDDKIHCVYAGVLEPRKGSGLAVETALYLPKNYHIHIIGFGTEADKKALQQRIEEISTQTECTVSFDGKFSGDDYLDFIGSCKIGLSPQNPDATFNETSFPSKVLSYLSSGLRVVSVRIKSIETSKVSNLLNFYDGNDPKTVAEAIKAVDLNGSVDSRQVIKGLDEEFTQKLFNIIK